MFNTKKKIFLFYGITFLVFYILSIVWAVLIAKLEPDVSFSYLFHKNILLNLLVCPFYVIYKEVGVFALIILSAVSLFVFSFSIILSIKKNKAFPFCLIMFLFSALYFFCSSPFFIIWGDVVERLRKDYTKINEFEFYWHDARERNWSFEDVAPNTIHIVSYKECFLNDDEKVALVNGQIIINAIEKFYTDTKMYPDALEQLIPIYLENLPGTEYNGIWASQEFYYGKHDDNRWYDLRFYGFFTKYYWNNNKKYWEFEDD